MSGAAAGPALFIGGVGGSGTRVVARLVERLGVHIGDRLNRSLDNLDWPGDRPLVLDGSLSADERLARLRPGFERFAEIMASGAGPSSGSSFAWACKVPGSFFYLPYLARIFDDVRYIHVMRHGLDMAYSRNQNQLRNWGAFFDKALPDADSPSARLRYWVLANGYAVERCRELLPDRHWVIRFEELCADPQASVDQLASILGVATPPRRTARLAKGIRTPKSAGRYRALGHPSHFEKDDVAAVRRFGYPVRW